MAWFLKAVGYCEEWKDMIGLFNQRGGESHLIKGASTGELQGVWGESDSQERQAPRQSWLLMLAGSNAGLDKLLITLNLS